ncbi:T9SS type A sorting domain-containing protein [bacterium]|nr:T9SS type A sorting domain-containing protein [bacterium]
MLGIAVKWLLHFSDAAFITGINLLIHTTILIGICLACRSVVMRRGGKAATQSVLLRTFLVAALLSPLTLSLFKFTGMNALYLSATLLYPPEYTYDLSRESTHSQTSSQMITIQKSGETVSHENTQQNEHASDNIPKVNSPVKNNESIKVSLPSGVQVQKRPELAVPGSVEKSMKDHAGRLKATISTEKVVHGLAVVFTIVWCVFSMFLFVRFIAINLYIRRIRQLASEAKPAYREICRKAAGEFGIKPPAIFQSHYVYSTMITGFFKPSIILPSGANEVPMASREVFLHELAHFARRDYLWNQLGQISKILFPFQPLLWILARLIEETSDYVCDDYVVKFSTVNRSYATQLYNLALNSQPACPKIQTGAGIVSTGSPFRRRIERILDNSYARHVKINANEAMSITLLFICSITFTGFIRVDRPGAVQQSKYVTKLVKDTIETKADDSFTVKRYPDNHFSSGYSDSRMTEYDSEKEHEHIKAKKNADRDGVQVSEKVTGYNPDQGMIVSRTTYGQNPGNIPGIMQVNNIPNEKTAKPAESTEHNTEARPEIENSDDNSTAIQAPEPETANNHEADTVNVHLAGGYDSGMAVSFSSADGKEYSEDIALKAVKVTITYDYENADSNNPADKKMSAMYRSLDKNKMYPVWSPDGKKLAFSDENYGIWMVPSEGGEPTLVYDNYYKIDYKGYKLQLGGLETLGFSPDGNEIAFLRPTIDQELGTEVVIDNLGSQIQITVNNPIPVIEIVNIETGESHIIARNATSGRWSYDGRYFFYSRRNAELFKELVITDTRTGVEWLIKDFLSSPIYFPMHDSYLMFSKSDLYRVREENGILEELSFDEKSDLSDISPDGKWILYTDTHNGRKQAVYNTKTGESSDVFPGMDIQPYWAKFSPDASKICFCLKTGSAPNYEWKMYICDTPFTGDTPSEAVSSIPAVFELKGNYPNPFNLSTTIGFSLPENGPASLVIYNIMGQKVRELISEQMEAGYHTVVWDSRDDSGKTAASGTYIARLSAGKHTATGRMMLVK